MLPPRIGLVCVSVCAYAGPIEAPDPPLKGFIVSQVPQRITSRQRCSQTEDPRHNFLHTHPHVHTPTPRPGPPTAPPSILVADAWESGQPGFVDFPLVRSALACRLNAHFADVLQGRTIDVLYLCGCAPRP